MHIIKHDIAACGIQSSDCSSIKSKLIRLYSIILLSVISFSAFADGVGFTDGRAGQIASDLGFRKTTNSSFQNVFGFVQSGQTLTLEFQRVNNRTSDYPTGPFADLTVHVYSANSLVETFTINAAQAPDNSNHKSYTASSGNEGIWTVVLDGGDNRTFWRWDFNVRNSPSGARINGRIFTEEVLISQRSAFASRITNFDLFHVRSSGHQYTSTWYDYQGIDSRISTDIFGNKHIAAPAEVSCAPTYKSQELVLPKPICDGRYKQFFSVPSSTLPVAALRYNVSSLAAYSDWLLPLLGTTPTIGQITWNGAPSPAQPLKGAFSFDITGFDENAKLYVDVNNNGSFNDAFDRELLFVAGPTNLVNFDGLDKQGNAIPCGTTLRARVAIGKIGEIHFVLDDVEGLGGIRITRINGSGAPNSTIYWDDTDLSTVGRVSTTPISDGTAGYNSNVTGGVHGWSYPGALDTWGDNRSIDNWAYVPITVSNEVIIAPTFNCINVSGNVWNDGNGDAIRNIGENLIDELGLYANLVDPVTGRVLQSVLVNATNGYTFGGVLPGTAYKIILTENEMASNSLLDQSSIPNQWVYTGVNLMGTADVSNGTGAISLITPTTDLEEQNFGIEKIPTADSKFFSLPFPPASGLDVALNGTYLGATPALLTQLTGDDREDSPGPNGFPIKVRITSAIEPLGTVTSGNGPILYYDTNGNGVLDSGEELLDGDLIEVYDPNKLHVIFSGTGYSGFEFNYKTIDAAGQESNEALYYVNHAELPVTLVSFKAYNERENVQLIWTTTQETNSERFEVEHSVNGKNWNLVGTVSSSGESKDLKRYSLTHLSPLNGQNLYRLKMIDLDATFAYSSIVHVHFVGELAYVYPNPTSGLVKFNASGSSYPESAQLLNTSGKAVYEFRQIPADGIQLKGVVSKGIYLLKISHKDGTQATHKIIVSD
jgi:hypothetical protein